MGRIGVAVARIAEAFGMRVLSHRRRPDPASVPLDRLLEQSDVLSLHCPLTPDTRGLIDAAHLGRMKPGALLINTGRGGLINEADLAASLASGHLGGAGLDVLSLEPPQPDHPLLSAPNCLITPHVAWATRAARQRLIAVSAQNVAALLAGEPIHVVNGV
jgi:glycerate dehydrogenase